HEYQDSYISPNNLLWHTYFIEKSACCIHSLTSCFHVLSELLSPSQKKDMFSSILYAEQQLPLLPLNHLRNVSSNAVPVSTFSEPFDNLHWKMHPSIV